MNVLAISGSLRIDSNSTALLRALREEAPYGVDVALSNDVTLKADLTLVAQAA